jgi:hypothetical protein
MPIHFLCPFGHQLVVPDERAGKKGRCPVCHQKVYVPVPNPQPSTRSKLLSGEVDIVVAESKPAPGPMSALDQILAEELGLTASEAPVATPKPSSPPPLRKPAPQQTDSPYSPAPGMTTHSDVAPPGMKSTVPRDLSSPGRPVREAVPPNHAVPVPGLTNVVPEPNEASFTLTSPHSPSTPASAPTPPAWPPAPLPAKPAVPPALQPSSPAPANYFQTPASTQPTNYRPVPDAAPAATLIPLAPQAPAPMPSALPMSTLPSSPTAAMAVAPVRVFSPNDPLPWTVEASDSETQHELIINDGWPQTTYLIVAAMLAVAGLGVVPLISRWNGGVMPQWVTIVVGLTVVEVAVAVWLASLPDWSMLNLAGIATGLIAACYASGLAIVITNASANALPLDLFDVRNYAGGWCTGNALCWGMMSYALVRTSRQWKRNLRRLLRPV